MPFVRSKVKRLVESGQVIQVDSVPRCTNPLSVTFKINSDGSIKKRLVIDLSRWVNEFIVPDRFRMARFQDALSQAAPGDFQSVYDISKAYHHLLLHPDSYELVGFCIVDEEGKERFYHYVVVVFGLGPAGQLLGRMMRPILRKLSEMGLRNVMYVDDGWVIASIKDKADADYAIALFYFKGAGFIVALEKTDPVGAPSQRKEYLGFLIDMKAMTVEFPRQKMLRIKELLEKFLTSNTHKVREIASIIGKLNALEPALGKSIFVGTRLATIAVVVVTEVSDNVKRRRNPWESILRLDEETMTALKEVNDGMEIWNGHPIRAWHTGITLSSMPMEATASLDRTTPRSQSARQEGCDG
jgi:hypothetical protein